MIRLSSIWVDPLASTIIFGIVRLATNAEAKALSLGSVAVTPANLAAVFAEPPTLGNTTPAAVVATTLTVDTDTLVIDDVNNRVGIGTTGPSYKLEVRGSGDMFALGGGAAVTHKFGFDGVGNPYVDGVNTNKLLFRTGGSDRVAIDSSGNVGIGTTSPNAPLNVKGTAGGNAPTIIAEAAHNPSIEFHDSGQAADSRKWQIIGNSGSLYYRSINDARSAFTTYMEATRTGEVHFPSGNVGIGTTAPAEKLHVAGGAIAMDKTITAVGTTGAQTINKPTGSVNFAAAAASLVVTNSFVTVNSVINCTVASNDATMKSVQVVAAAGSFTIYPDAVPTAETRVNFMITN